jgi:serine/threonine-protein kinase
LSNRQFSESERLSEMLRFMVEETLAGRPTKEHVIALEIFGRGDEFDPKLDPIVRVQAGRLRARLAQYYAADGRNDPVRIEFNQRGYQPIFRLRGDTPGGSLSRMDESIPERASVAVLPFVNHSENRCFDHLGDSISGEMIFALSRFPGLRVAARTSAFHFREHRHDTRQIGRALDVRNLVEGAVSIADDRIRITVQLVDTATGHCTWSERYERPMSDIFALQEEIAYEIASRLRFELKERFRRMSMKRYTTSVAAYQCYLEGRHYLQRGTPDGLNRARSSLKEAIVLDPGYSLAHVALANYYINLALLGLSDPLETRPNEVAHLQNALCIDDTLAEAHALWGAHLAIAQYDWNGAEKAFRIARTLDPGCVVVRNAYVQTLLRPLGRIEEALAEIEMGLAADPISPHLRWLRAYMLYFGRLFNEAEKQCRRTLDIEPQHHLAYWTLGLSCEARGELGSAIVAYERAVSLFSRGPAILCTLGAAYARAGRNQDAIRILTELRRRAENGYVPDAAFAVVFFGLNRVDEGFAWLERALARRDPLILTLTTHSVWDPVRSDRRFAAVTERLGLTDPSRDGALGRRASSIHSV